MSERKQIELDRELLLDGTEKARLAAESAIRSKDEFLATISHELRNPLNGILGWTQILRRGGSDEEEVARGIELIDMSARTLVQLVDDLLDISRITAGKMRLTLAPTDLKRVVDAACQSISPSAAAKGVTLDCRIPAGLPHVLGDGRRLQQIAWNLLTNAVKFTPRGGRVEIDAESREGQVVLTVRDSGIGIPPEFIEQVFDPFSQHESTSTRRYRGLGLGLAIVRNLAELHGGSVRAMSDGPDRGSTFAVTLPLAVGPEVGSGEGAPTSGNGSHSGRLAGVRVLIVDDDPAAREMLPLLLGRAGATSHTAESAESGLSALLSFRPHVLLSDIEMPATDGYEFLRRVRALADDEGGAVPAAALTAYVREEERQRILLAGFQAHLGKPVDAAMLVETVARLAGRSTAA
jgi:CheY-like chemotaxis protein